MRLQRRRLRLLGTGLLAATVGAGILLVGLAGAATDTKPFTATISVNPDANPLLARADAWAGTIPTVTISIRNDASPQTLGSANITVPEGIVPKLPLPPGIVITDGNVIQLRNLNLAPGATTSVSLPARIPCGPDLAEYPWEVYAKQSNDFNGTGNDFTPKPALPVLYGAGVCRLAFTADGQPTSAQRLSNITADPFLPIGPPDPKPVAVRVVDASPGAGTVTWLDDQPVMLAIHTYPGGVLPASVAFTGKTATTVGGVARFPSPQINVSGSGYRLTASSIGITGTAPVSGTFNIVDSGLRCKANVNNPPCSGTTSNAKFAASVTAPTAQENDLLFLSLGAPDELPLDCANYTETTDILTFDVTTLSGGSSSSGKTTTFTILNPGKSAPQYDVCFESPIPFTPKSLASTKVTTGLLPDCRKVNGVAPCVSDRARVNGAVVITFTAPPGDPRAHF